MDPYLLHSIAATATPPDSSREPHHGDESGPVELVVTADDLGVCAARNRGILYAMTRGAVTHTSLLANGPAALEGLRMMRRAGLLHRVGLHLNLTEGRPVSRPEDIPSLLQQPEDSERSKFDDSSGKERLFLGKARFVAACAAGTVVPEEAAAEAAAQLDFFRRHSAGHDPYHVDGHQHCHVQPALAPALAKVLLPVGRATGIGQEDEVTVKRSIRRLRIPQERGYGHDPDHAHENDHNYHSGSEDESCSSDGDEDDDEGGAPRIPFCGSCRAVQNMCPPARRIYQGAVGEPPPPSDNAASSLESSTQRESDPSTWIPDAFVGCSMCGFASNETSPARGADNYAAKVLQAIDVQIAVHRRRQRRERKRRRTEEQCGENEERGDGPLAIELMCHPGFTYTGGILATGLGYGSSEEGSASEAAAVVGGWDAFNEDPAREEELLALCGGLFRAGLRSRSVRLRCDLPPSNGVAVDSGGETSQTDDDNADGDGKSAVLQKKAAAPPKQKNKKTQEVLASDPRVAPLTAPAAAAPPNTKSKKRRRSKKDLAASKKWAKERGYYRGL